MAVLIQRNISSQNKMHDIEEEDSDDDYSNEEDAVGEKENVYFAK